MIKGLARPSALRDDASRVRVTVREAGARLAFSPGDEAASIECNWLARTVTGSVAQRPREQGSKRCIE